MGLAQTTELAAEHFRKASLSPQPGGGGKSWAAQVAAKPAPMRRRFFINMLAVLKAVLVVWVEELKCCRSCVECVVVDGEVMAS